MADAMTFTNAPTTKEVLSPTGLVVWEDVNKQGENDNGTKYWSLGLIIPPNAPNLAAFQAAYTQELTEGVFKGNDAKHKNGSPIKVVAAGDFSTDAYVGWYKIDAKRYFTERPQIYTPGPVLVEDLDVSALVYTGAEACMTVTPTSYNSSKNKGIKFSLGAILIMDSTKPKLSLSSKHAEPDRTDMLAGARGIGSSAPPVAAPPVAAPPVAAPPVSVAPKMLPAAKGASYDSLVAAGWTDALLVQHQMMAPPVTPNADFLAPPPPV